MIRLWKNPILPLSVWGDSVSGGDTILNTHCRKGHLYTEETTYILPSNGFRQCLVCKKAADKNWRELNKERKAASTKKHYEANKEQYYARAKQWKLKNPKKLAEAGNRFYWKHVERCREIAIKAAHKRRVRLEGSTFPMEEWKKLLNEFNGFCNFCETFVEKLTVGHVTPVSKGGLNNIENLVPQCKSCNSKQRDKYIYEKWPEKFINYLEVEAHV